MKLPGVCLIGLCILLCNCSQPQAEGVRVYRLHTASAPTEEAAPHQAPTQHLQPQQRNHFVVTINEALLKQNGHKHLEINLATQRGVFYINGQPALEFPVCTGMPGYETPTGSFTIKEKRRHHRSNIYHVSMPCFMRLTYDGIGLHVGDIRATPSSHGCIRLPKEACLPIFNAVSYGTRVDIYHAAE